jgi:hypothetical protein
MFHNVPGNKAVDVITLLSDWITKQTNNTLKNE